MLLLCWLFSTRLEGEALINWDANQWEPPLSGAGKLFRHSTRPTGAERTSEETLVWAGESGGGPAAEGARLQPRCLASTNIYSSPETAWDVFLHSNNEGLSIQINLGDSCQQRRKQIIKSNRNVDLSEPGGLNFELVVTTDRVNTGCFGCTRAHLMHPAFWGASTGGEWVKQSASLASCPQMPIFQLEGINDDMYQPGTTLRLLWVGMKEDKKSHT